jgi:hypothetical protein
MKIKAIISCFSDHAGGRDLIRLEKTLSHFYVHNPDIPVTVINDAGTSPIDVVKKFPNYTLKNETENSYVSSYWNTKDSQDSRIGYAGTFGILWYRRIFEFALADDDYSHIVFLETDVFARGRITQVPKFDMAGYGMVSWDGANDFYCDYFNLPKTKHIEYHDPWQNHNNKISFLHYGTGGTIFSKSFFQKCYKNLHMMEELYKSHRGWFCNDLGITSLGTVSNCTVGEWEDLTVNEESISWLKNRKEILRAPTGKEALVHQHEF